MLRTLQGSQQHGLNDSDPSEFDIIEHNNPKISYDTTVRINCNSTVERAVTVMADGKTVKLGHKLGDMFSMHITDAGGTKSDGTVAV